MMERVCVHVFKQGAEDRGNRRRAARDNGVFWRGLETIPIQELR